MHERKFAAEAATVILANLPLYLTKLFSQLVVFILNLRGKTILTIYCANNT